MVGLEFWFSFSSLVNLTFYKFDLHGLSSGTAYVFLI